MEESRIEESRYDWKLMIRIGSEAEPEIVVLSGFWGLLVSLVSIVSLVERD